MNIAWKVERERERETKSRGSEEREETLQVWEGTYGHGGKVDSEWRKGAQSVGGREGNVTPKSKEGGGREGGNFGCARNETGEEH